MRLFKRRAVHLALAAFALWPVVQIGLVRAYDVNPWKLAGWGMYAVPQIPARVHVWGLTAKESYEVGSLPPETQRSLDTFLERRRGLRGLARPTALGKQMLAHYSAIEGIRIVVIQPRLNPRTGLIEERATTYEYRR